MNDGDFSLAEFGLTPDEAKRVTAKIDSLKKNGKTDAEALPIAISMEAPSKAKAEGPVSASFEADTGSIKLKGGDYVFHNDGDGYFTCPDFPLFSEVEKGTKGAPKNVRTPELESLVKHGVAQYHESSSPRCAPVFKKHNPSIEGFGSDPEFLGFMIPKRVGPYRFHDGTKEATKQTAFGPIKLNKSGLEQMQRGELIAHSPEFNWRKWRMTGLAFLPTRPPHFEYANNTVKQVIDDKSAKFAAVLSDEDAARFDEGDPMLKEEFAAFKAEIEKQQKETGEKIDNIAEALKGLTSQGGKPDAKPVEVDDSTKKEAGHMNMTPDQAAQFAGLVDKAASFEAKFEAMENEKKAAALIKKAEKKLETKAITADCMKLVAQFAADAVGKDNGEAWFDKTIEQLSTSLREKPPRDMGDFFSGEESTVDPRDPVVSKFSAEGPEVMGAVAKFSAQHDQLKAKLGDRYNCPKDKFIELELDRWKDERSGTFAGNRRN